MRIYTDRFHVGAGTTVGPLTVFPVWGEKVSSLRHAVSSDARMRVTELDTPTVGRLNVANTANHVLLVPEGTILDGGHQTRVVVRDQLIVPGTNRDIEVRCVEQGRWGGNGEHEVDGRAPISVVAALRGITANGAASADQGEVWRRVSKLEEKFGRRETNSLLDVMAEHNLNTKPERVERGRRVNGDRRPSRITPQLVAELRRIAANQLPGQSGVLVGLGGVPLALDLYGHYSSLGEQIQAVLSAMLIDSTDLEWRPTPGQIARDFAEEIMYTPVDITRQGSISRQYSGAGEHVNIRAITAHRADTTALHLGVINHRHQVALAA